jgi:membrane protease YdiL (CAAX protease family)
MVSLIKRNPQATFWIIAWLTFAVGNLLGGMWFLLIYCVFLGGVFVTAIADGRLGLKTLFSRIVHWRVGIQWYAVALLTPAVLYLAAAGLNVLSGARIAPNIQWPTVTATLIAFAWPGFFGVALAEEPGFRGFALPRLLSGHSAISAALILGILHAIWHIPTFIGGDAISIGATILIVISGAVLNTWLFNNTNGSVLTAMLMHASIDVVSGDFGLLKNLFTGADLARQIVWLAVAYTGAAILLPILAGKELGRKPDTAQEPTSLDRFATAK